MNHLQAGDVVDNSSCSDSSPVFGAQCFDLKKALLCIFITQIRWEAFCQKMCRQIFLHFLF